MRFCDASFIELLCDDLFPFPFHFLHACAVLSQDSSANSSKYLLLTLITDTYPQLLPMSREHAIYRMKINPPITFLALHTRPPQAQNSHLSAGTARRGYISNRDCWKEPAWPKLFRTSFSWPRTSSEENIHVPLSLQGGPLCALVFIVRLGGCGVVL